MYTLLINPMAVISNYEFLLLVISYYYNLAISPMSRVFANGLGDRCSIPGRVIPRTKKIVLDITLLNT